MSDRGTGAGQPDGTGRSDLFVSGADLPRARLRPKDSPVRFGRAYDADLRVCGPRDTAVSRKAGSLLWHDGLWYVRNESRARPLYVIVDGGSYPLHPLRADGTPATWAVAPPGLTLRFLTPVSPIDIQVETVRHGPDPLLVSVDPDPDSPSTPRGRLRPRDRLLNSAKFLAHGVDGPILGDKEAAAIGNTHLPPGENKFTHNAVMMAVTRARQALTDVGVTDLGGPHNIPKLRRELLCWGLLTEQDGHWLRDGPAGSGERRDER